MSRYFSRFTTAALVAVALLSDTAGAQTIETAKLDESLRESVERGCHGRQEVIITVEPGYREALSLALSVHGDKVTGEFPAINAIAADIHCDDLVALAAFGSIRAVSTNAAIGVAAAKTATPTAKQDEKAALKLARELEAQAAKALKKNAFATIGATKLRDVKPVGVMLVPGEATLTNSVTGAFQTSLKSSTYTGGGVGVAMIDSGIEERHRLRRPHHRLLRLHEGRREGGDADRRLRPRHARGGPDCQQYVGSRPRCA